MKLNEVLDQIKHDLRDGNFTLTGFGKSYLFDPSFRLLLNFRIGKYLNSSPIFFFRFFSFLYKNSMYKKRSCQISYNSILGKGIKFAHPIGIVIGDRSIVGDNVTIFQNVTLGSNGRVGLDKYYPIIENEVTIFAGAKIIGGITIGYNSVIGANSVVMTNIPPNSVAVGIPAKVIRKVVQ